MIARFLKAVVARGIAWCRSRAPTRESIVVVAAMAVIFEATYLAAFFIRGELLFKPSDAKTIISTIALAVSLKLVVFYARGLCHRPWHAARFADLNNLLRASSTCLLVLVACNAFGSLLPGWVPIPRSVLLLDWAFTLIGIGGMQALARSIHEELMPATTVGNQRRVLVIDASDAGRRLAIELGQSGDAFVSGLLDDDPDHYGVSVGRARVLGPISMAAACAERLRVSDIVILERALFGAGLRALCDVCATKGVRVSMAQSESGASPPSAGSKGIKRAFRLRSVELRDLLSSPRTNLGGDDPHVRAMLQGATVLVTGAGGSIGREICRHVLRFDPQKLILVERSEPALCSIHGELSREMSGSGSELVQSLCDVSNADRIERVFIEHKPDVVIHAAAFKHVPLMESHPVDAIENNAIATASLAELADACGVKTFVALSTDKAVHPSSVMGASKLVADRFLDAFGETSRTRFVSVRFGNVIGSSGNVIQSFEERLTLGLPITVTHPSVRRHFMTLDEAAQLVLLAGALSGRSGTYVIDTGASIPIVDVVHSLAFVRNVPMEKVHIEYCGLRPGEKLDEDLYFEDEHREATPNPLLFRASRPARPLNDVRSWLAELKSAANTDPGTAAQMLMGIVSSDCGQLTSIDDERPVPSGGPSSAAVLPELTAAWIGKDQAIDHPR